MPAPHHESNEVWACAALTCVVEIPSLMNRCWPNNISGSGTNVCCRARSPCKRGSTLKIDSDNVLEAWYRLYGPFDMLLLLSRLSLGNLKRETWLDRRRGACHELYVFLLTCRSFSTLFGDSFNSVGARTSHEEVTKFRSIQISLNSSHKTFVNIPAAKSVATSVKGSMSPGSEKTLSEAHSHTMSQQLAVHRGVFVEQEFCGLSKMPF